MQGAMVSVDAVVRQGEGGVLILCGRCGDTVCEDDGEAIVFPVAIIDAIEFAYAHEGWHFDDVLGKWCCGTCSMEGGE